MEVKSPGWCSQFHFCCPLQCWAHGSPPVVWGRTCFVRPPCANTLVSPFLPQIAYIFSVQSLFMPKISKLYLCWPISTFTVTGGITVWINPHKFCYHAQISLWHICLPFSFAAQTIQRQCKLFRQAGQRNDTTYEPPTTKIQIFFYFLAETETGIGKCWQQELSMAI